MAKYNVIKTFRDRESDLKVQEVGSSYDSDNKKWTDYLIERGYLKSADEQSTLKEVEKKEEKPKRTTRKKASE